jgi:hypothetical protein
MIIPPRLANQEPSRASLSAEGGKHGRSMQRRHHHVIHQPDRGPTSNNLHAPARPLLPKLMAPHDYHHCLVVYTTTVFVYISPFNWGIIYFISRFVYGWPCLVSKKFCKIFQILCLFFFCEFSFSFHSSRGYRITFFGHQVLNAGWGYMPLTQPDDTCDLLS